MQIYHLPLGFPPGVRVSRMLLMADKNEREKIKPCPEYLARLWERANKVKTSSKHLGI